jgi:hypothetical protein
VSCRKCRNKAVVEVDQWPPDMPVALFGSIMECSKCGTMGAKVRLALAGEVVPNEGSKGPVRKARKLTGTNRRPRRSAAMKKVENYRTHAAECRTMARRSSPEERDMLLKMAETWDYLASSREGQIAWQQRMESIASGPGGEKLSIPIDRLNAENDD